ncbi:hybrid sensor histidine kinase/response regulator [bacterium]|nr:hybrid sensor histidine kinase/response regulator [bacterium]
MINTALHPVVLIVDDEPSARSTIEALLYPEGYVLKFADCAEVALEMMTEITPDTILMDLMMPGMDGLEACEIIRQNPNWRHIPIILITALDSKEDLRRALAAGATDFIAKPANGTELRARTRSMLRIKSQYDRLQNMLQLREDMANMVVHDMRSPLTSILGYSELLRKSLDSEQAISDLDKISSEARRMNGYFSDLLLMAKMEADKLIVHLTTVDVNSLIVKVFGHHSIIARAKSIRLSTDLDDTITELSADSSLLEKVIDNLISNAIKYTASDSEVIVRTRQIQRQGINLLEIRFEDHGPGIPDAHREKIFDKFNIVEMKNKNVSQVGLGLAFCKLAVQAHNWTIRVEDNMAQGSIFIIDAVLN